MWRRLCRAPRHAGQTESLGVGSSILAMARPKTPSLLSEIAVRLARQRWSRRKSVISVHWGAVYRHGGRTKAAGIVVFVERKVEPKRLSSRQAFPRWLVLRRAGRLHRVRVDVQGTGRYGTLHATLARPGTNAAVELGSVLAPLDGTLSAAVPAPANKMRVVLSGHVAGAAGRPVTAIDSDGAVIALGPVEQVVRNGRVDVAWTEPVALAAANRVTALPRPVRDFVNTDVHASVRLITRANDRGLLATVDDVNATGTFRDGTNVITLRGMTTVVPARTNPGDSGAPAIAEDGSLAGFVLGVFAGKTYLLPARRAIDEVP